MENTTSNKRKLFAQYWDQKVMTQHNPANGLYDMHNRKCIFGLNKLELEYLQLKSLKDISDRDAYEVGLLINCWSRGERKSDWFKDDDMKDVHIMGGGSFAESIGKEWGKGLSHPFANSTTDILAAYDVLRSKGYALPYNTLTVEKQIEYGWIKIK